jgi:hypothetical protein
VTGEVDGALDVLSLGISDCGFRPDDGTNQHGADAPCIARSELVVAV